MFQKILFATDFSPISERAVDFVLKLKDAGAEEVVVLSAVDSASVMAPTATTTKQAEDVARRFEDAGFQARTAVEVEDPADFILRNARNEDADVIVMGATGKGHLKELVLGSVSEKVARNSHIPVLLIKH